MSRRASWPLSQLTAMALLQISEPGASPDPHQRRIAVGIDLGTTNSWSPPCATAWPNACPMRRAKSSCPLRCATWAMVGGRSAPRPWRRRPTTPSTPGLGQALHGANAGRWADAGKLPYRFVDRPGMLAIETREGVKSPSRSRPRSWRLCASAPRTAFTTSCSAPSSPCRPI